VTERDTGPDPLGDLQRWLMRTGARSVTKEMTGSVRRALGQDRPAADVWDTATNRPEDEAPECAWCPVCRAARRMRERQGAGSGLGSTLTGASDALASVVQEAYTAFESAMKPPPGRPTSSGPSASRPSSRWEDAGREPDDRR
jgi:hypothetical protein